MLAAIVPVTQFRAPWTSTDAAEVASVLAGTSRRYASLELVAGEEAPILAAVAPLAQLAAGRLILAATAAKLRTDLAAHRDRLAILAAADVDPSVRALAWGDVALFGTTRVKALADWPLMVDLSASTASSGPGTGAAYDPATAWTLFAGGDILLDRGIALTVTTKGVDFPFDGGTATITSHYCCSSFGWQMPRTRRTGDAGAVRDLVSGADLAIANFENPAPDTFRYHDHGTVFSANPALIKGLKDAGIDWVSLANNHVGDAGRTGILQTMANLDARGIAHGGAGKDWATAHAASLLDVGGIHVAILGYDTIAPGYWATPTKIGSAHLTADAVKADVAAARAAGADLVIVFPHWGVEYHAVASSGQRALAHAAIDAGADLVIGNHPHWAETMEVYRGHPIWYALGNFVFDQTWSEPTMEGITLELTFQGTRLVQVRMRPHLILDRSQPNFMDPMGSGKVVMNQLWGASKGLLGW